jgi:hypothetical protein
MGRQEPPAFIPPLIPGLVPSRYYRRNNPAADEADAEFREAREQIFETDKHSCLYCGVKSKKGMQAHHLDGNHENNRHSNLVTVCPLCHAVFHFCFHVEPGNATTLGKTMMIIVCPELRQADINLLCWTAGIAGLLTETFGEDGLKTRKGEAVTYPAKNGEKVGQEVPNPAALIDSLHDALVNPGRLSKYLSRTSGAPGRTVAESAANYAVAFRSLAKARPDLYRERESFLGDLRILFRFRRGDGKDLTLADVDFPPASRPVRLADFAEGWQFRENWLEDWMRFVEPMLKTQEEQTDQSGEEVDLI